MPLVSDAAIVIEPVVEVPLEPIGYRTPQFQAAPESAGPGVVYLVGSTTSPQMTLIESSFRDRGYDVGRVARLLDAWRARPAEQCAVIVAEFPFASMEDDIFVRSLRELPGGEYCVLVVVAREDASQTLNRIAGYPVDDVVVPPLSEGQLRVRVDLALRRQRELEDRKRSGSTLRGRTRFERLLVNISMQFITITPGDIQRGIQTALEQIGEYTHADRAYVAFFDPAGTSAEHPFEWCADGIASHVDILKGKQRSSYPWFVRQYVDHRMINVPDVCAIPEDAEEERALLMRQGIRSLICLPLMWEGKITGYVGLDSVRASRIWSEDVITLLTVCGQIFTNAWERCRSESRRTEIETQMQHAQKLESLGVLAGGIAHDFNNLLVGILANAGLALLDLPRTSGAYHRVAQIELAAQRAGELTNQMLAYAGKGRFVLQTVDLSELVREMTHLLEAAISKKVALRYEFDSAMPAIEADVAQIRQVVMNLITNASDAMMGKDGTIHVRTGVVAADRGYLSTMYIDDALPPDTYAYLEVTDTGCGMDEETRSRIFDPFFTTKFSGHGLGLAAVLGIVRAHKGSIKVISAPGKGTTFRVIIPCVKRTAETNGEARSSTMDGKSKMQLGATVLVVDDEDMVREVAQTVLEHAGCHVLNARDAVEAIAQFSECRDRIDVVLLDLSMPGLGGDDVCRELKRIDPNVRVVLSSGYSEEDATRCFGSMALAGFIQKPYRASELTSKIASVLAGGSTPDLP